MSTPDYTLETGDNPITENTTEHIRRMMNKLSAEDWRRRQKVWSAFFAHHADQRSFPRKKEPYSSLVIKIMTETIWTNKRKKRYNLTECSDIMEENIMDSQLTLGECIFTRELNDQLWATLKQFWDKKMGNKGLIPCNLATFDKR
ncbi:hypothetical protein PROFUN_16449 [Planoprotostelium fungivorum]|uniref:Uncharacterized protein n=1 Tax=Planoprotostelium fungivorum TaxID=1890364 RepID=A0A2P6MQJ1_9EUKA|nr:hypothetical protein PROFUN_16449 [Planoprotostelium fungivorum]